MKKFYKVFLVLFIVFITINLYAINWQATDILGDEDNIRFAFSAGAAAIGLILLFVMDTWSRIGVKK
ncbi:uncharacterized membrane protein (DUF485 family) [Chryseobacterium bernardetii]|jgi:uncharacterized membrane protein (DUF485 family)|uniref:Uncharacterized protein n=4 Tax=Chryseobacterium TaxID=59732 RepID=A0A2S9D0M5_CHRCI|nr:MULTISPECIES: hypothetical protein [Chryseobacterium]MBP1167822.1 uncharacterized membrane protein (DUF485 family) [Chryseobacterium sp. PvR013]MDQ1855052.1 hypothetical protein [Chryseobacterium sp. WLY505]MDR4892874.1 hypothetical protein [Chryseobacterium sp. CFS7]MDR4952661.1 hypothetical protein [Chryseobacterium sp. ES2]MDR6369023.1 uncharacterized membrane protein (DUF485 family) [Chryseobacterium vietnamense]